MSSLYCINLWALSKRRSVIYTLSMTTISVVLLMALALLTASLQRTYGHVPVKELKRRARSGDKAAKALHRAATFGPSLRALLWLVIVVLNASLYLLLARESNTFVALLLIAFVLWTAFVWLPAREATAAGVWLATAAAPVLEKLLQYVHPIFDRVHRFVNRHRPVTIHTGLYDKQDLQELFARQKVQADNRVDQQILEIAEHALAFGDKKVSDILTPRRVVKAVSITDAIGPILLDDLHKSGFSRFPVYDGKQDNIVGVLNLKSLVQTKAGQVSKLMTKQVCYVHEDQPLTEALQAILTTHQQLYIVVNTFEEYVGVVSIEDILEEIVGKQIVDELDKYDDLRAVAASMAKREHKNHETLDSPHENIQEVTEVIE